jgi:hypothetical protein
VPRETETRAHRLALQRDRHQQDGGHVPALGLLVLGPAQQADRQVQRVGAAFLEAGARGRVDGQEASVELVRFHFSQQIAVRQRL